MLVKDKISFERKRRGMRLEDLGKAICVDKATLCRYENGRVKTIPEDVLHRIASVLNLDFNKLVEDDPQYCAMQTVDSPTQLSKEDKQLLNWFHSLPADIQRVIKQFWSIQI